MKKTITISIFIGLIISSIFFGITTAAAGWLTGWRYCRAIVIRNSSDKELTNYFVKVENPIYEESGLLGSWNFDTFINGKSPDSSGNGKDAVVYGAALAKGKFGMGLNLNGQGGYVDCGSIGLVTTIEFYIDDSNYNDGILELNPNTYISIASGEIVTTGINAPLIYVNGVRGKVLSKDFNHIVVLTAKAIDASAVKIGVANSYYTRGLIDEVRFYNWKLRNSDIASHYQAKAKLNYQDIRFMDPGKAIPLKYCIEKDGVFWVKVPLISKLSNKIIYIYYGNDKASAVSDTGLLAEIQMRKTAEIEPTVNVYAEQENL